MNKGDGIGVVWLVNRYWGVPVALHVRSQFVNRVPEAAQQIVFGLDNDQTRIGAFNHLPHPDERP